MMMKGDYKNFLIIKIFLIYSVLRVDFFRFDF